MMLFDDFHPTTEIMESFAGRRNWISVFPLNNDVLVPKFEN